jgi:sugar phosphate isomerase/epimerase
MKSRAYPRASTGLSRREFLFGSAAAVSATSLARAQDAATRAKLDRISVMTNDFDAILPEIWDRSKEVAPKELNMMDLPDAVADRLHLHNLEVCSINLLSMESSYIRKFKGRLDNAKSKVVDLVVELDPPETRYRGYISVCSTDPAIRAQAIEMTKKWIDIAAVLGAPSIMPNQGVHYLTEDLTPSIEGLRALVDYGKSKNVAVILEPRGQRLEQMVELLKGSGAYANPQTGSEEGLRLLYPLARTVQHVNVSPRFNIANTIKISKEMGFKGWYSIETGGPDPWASTQKVIDALLQNL